MALIFMDGFETGDQGIKWSYATGSSSANTRFSSGKSLLLTQTTERKYVPSLSQIYAGYAFSTPGFSYNGVGCSIYGDNGNTEHLTVTMFANTLQLRLGGYGSTVIASYNSVFYTNTWYYLEIMATIASSGGLCQVRLNGLTVINFTGTTKNGGTGTTIDAFELGSWSAGGGQCYFDDLYICDNTGATNNTFLGDVRIQTLLPTAAGSSTQLAPTGSANNYANANDVPDSTATYNSSSTVGNRDTYAMGDLLASTGTILGVQESLHAFKTDAGSASMKAALLSGATLAYDTPQNLGDTVAWSGAVREVDPNTSTAWTTVGVNAVELGGEVV